ncbi:MAG: NaeI family type II restriction endonuclease [Propionicimonas sp.]
MEAELFGEQASDAEEALLRVLESWNNADPDGGRSAGVFRSTFDQLYDGVHTGRFRWDQLYKTEKTHFGTLLEINLRREFSDIIVDGEVLDYRIEGEEIDCKYSQSDGGWMIPPEALGRLLLVAHANDAEGWWSVGVVRADPINLRQSTNRDRKTQLSRAGRAAIRWIARRAPLAPNVLLSLAQPDLERIMAPRTGQARVNELCRVVTNRRIGRNTIATVAQQDDYMKRVRYSGGARSYLASEGYIIPGDYDAHRAVAAELGAAVPEHGEVVSLRVVPAQAGDLNTTHLDGKDWRLAYPGEPVTTPAPKLPDTRRGGGLS